MLKVLRKLTNRQTNERNVLACKTKCNLF